MVHSNLCQLQILFYKGLQGDSNTVFSLIESREGIQPNEGLSIYKRGFIGRHVNALKETYPVCLRLVGEACFYAMARKYIQAFPSNFSDLNNYGDNFYRFIESYEPVMSLPYLPDVVRLEWSHHKAFFGPDAVTVDESRIQNLTLSSLERCNLITQSNSTLFTSEYPILKIWQVNSQQEEVKEVIHLEEGGIKLFVFRKEWEVTLCPIERDEIALLMEMLGNKTSMRQIVEIFCDRYEMELLLYYLKKIIKQWLDLHWMKK